MFGTHHSQSLAVHLRLRVVEVAEHRLALYVRLKVGAEERLTLDLDINNLLALTTITT